MSTLPNIAAYTDTKLDALAQALVVEQERRRDRDGIPEQVAALAAKYAAAGGDVATLTERLQPAEPADDPEAG